MAVLTTQANSRYKQPVDLVGSNASPITLTTSPQFSNPVDAQGYDYVIFWLFLDDRDSATKITAGVYTSDTPSTTSNATWVSLQTEAIASGVGTQSNYTQEKTVSGTLADPTLTLPISVPTRGMRFFRLSVKCDAGSPTCHVRVGYGGR
jgi:hypothetical protein